MPRCHTERSTSSLRPGSWSPDRYREPFREPAGEPVDIYAHSWGADTAAWGALVSNRKIDSFTSVDGVGWFKPDLSKLRCKVKDGTNINVVPENYDFGDFVAFIGSKCGVPKTSASTHVNA